MNDALVMAVGNRRAGLAEEFHPIVRGEVMLRRVGGDRLGIVDVFHDEVRH